MGGHTRPPLQVGNPRLEAALRAGPIQYMS